MSRIGKLPVAVPSEVKTSIANGAIHIEGPKGKLDFTLGRGISVAMEDNSLVVSATNTSDAQVRANFGTARATINNMVQGVTKGWTRVLEMNGVGFNAKVQGTKLVLACGFSHDVIFEIPKEIKCLVEKNTVIQLESANKQIVGTFASNIRKAQPPEPYLGKGIKYAEEKVRRKAGKTGKK